ncbi:MAG: thioesterase family protein [Polyangiaceae bacterium]
MVREPPKLRSYYKHFSTIETRWMDNDIYGHVNNVVYYSYFDTVINRYLISAGGLDIQNGTVIGVCAESQCRYFEALSFPDTISAGLRVARAGGTSVVYEIGLFRRGSEKAAAQGHFVHVFVERSTMRPTAIPDAIRASFGPLLAAP